jgi:hypothetical protein
MAQANGSKVSPPYLAFRTLANFVEGLRESGLPSRIDRTVMAGQSGSNQNYLLAAMRFLGFVDADGTPSDVLKSLVSNKAKEKEIYASAIQRAYQFLFNLEFDLRNATEGQILEKFQEQELSGETARKGLSFFAQACEFSGIQISPHLKAGKRAPRTAVRRFKRQSPSDDPNGGPVNNPPPMAQTQSLESMLLSKFPSFDPSWNDELKTKWFASFEQFMKAAKGGG